jgi:hypothetical protein
MLARLSPINLHPGMRSFIKCALESHIFNIFHLILRLLFYSESTHQNSENNLRKRYPYYRKSNMIIRIESVNELQRAIDFNAAGYLLVGHTQGALANKRI